MTATRSDERTPLIVKTADNGCIERTAHLSPSDLSSRERITTLLSVWLGVWLGALDTTIAATLITSISSEFSRSNQSGWLGTSYLLSTSVFTPSYGRLCDIAGRRTANLTAITMFAIGTLGCGLASSMNVLIAARFIAGAGGGGLMTTSSIIASDLFASQQRGLVQGITNVVYGLGAGLGGPLGGLLADTVGWRWAFLIQLPLLAVSCVLVSILVRYRLPGQGDSAKEKIKRIDYAGFFTLLVWVGSLLLAMSFKTNELYAWSSPQVLVPLLLSIVFLVLFVATEAHFSSEPIMPVHLIRQRSPLAINLANFLTSFISFSIIYFFPSFFEVVMGTSSGQAGAHLIVHAVPMSMGSLTSGIVIRKTGKYWWLNIISALLPLTALIPMSFIDESWPATFRWLIIAPSSFGFGSIVTTLLIALIAAVDRSSVATATGVSYLFRYTGQVIGVGLSASVLQGVLSAELSKRFSGPGSADLIDRIRHTATSIKTLPPGQRIPAAAAYKSALHAVFATNAGAAFLLFLCAIPIIEFPLAKTLAEADALERQRQAEGTRVNPS